MNKIDLKTLNKVIKYITYLKPLALDNESILEASFDGVMQEHGIDVRWNSGDIDKRSELLYGYHKEIVRLYDFYTNEADIELTEVNRVLKYLNKIKDTL